MTSWYVGCVTLQKASNYEFTPQNHKKTNYFHTLISIDFVRKSNILGSYIYHLKWMLYHISDTSIIPNFIFPQTKVHHFFPWPNGNKETYPISQISPQLFCELNCRLILQGYEDNFRHSIHYSIIFSQNASFVCFSHEYRCMSINSEKRRREQRTAFAVWAKIWLNDCFNQLF